MPHSAARTLDAESPRAPRTSPTVVSEPRKRRPEAPSARLARRLALAAELTRLEKDISELRDDFEARIGPLTKAYSRAAVALRKMKHVERHKPRQKRR